MHLVTSVDVFFRFGLAVKKMHFTGAGADRLYPDFQEWSVVLSNSVNGKRPISTLSLLFPAGHPKRNTVSGDRPGDPADTTGVMRRLEIFCFDAESARFRGRGGEIFYPLEKIIRGARGGLAFDRFL